MMDGKIFTFLLAALLSTQVSGRSDSYKGAVVEYHPVLGVGDKDTMAKNTRNYEKFIQQAKSKGADIIVFPESGLFGKIASPIPDPSDRVIPCDKGFNTTQAVIDLSCAAKNNGIYTVINLPESRECEQEDPNCPSSGRYVYNTNVVFDRRGAVIARYAKYNLFASDSADKPPEPEMTFFDTDFGVRFGTFICFDILFPAPAQRLVQQYGVTDFVFSTFWFSELPFLTALQAQRGWAESNNVNLLASGVNYPILGSSGSGIYNGKYGHLVQIMPEKTTSRLLVADIPKINPSSNFCPGEIPLYPQLAYNVYKRESSSVTVQQDEGEQSSEFLKFLSDPGLKNYKTEIIKEGQTFEKTICSNDKFCCSFKITMTALLAASKNYTYRAMAFNGVREFGAKFRGGAQLCEVVACSGPKIEDCGKRGKGISGLFRFKEISIKGNFKRWNSFQMPSTLTGGEELAPLPAYRYHFSRVETDKTAEVSLELLWPETNLHTFGVWGRDFTRDNETIESSASITVSAPVLFGAFLSFLMFVR